MEPHDLTPAADTALPELPAGEFTRADFDRLPPAVAFLLVRAALQVLERDDREADRLEAEVLSQPLLGD